MCLGKDVDVEKNSAGNPSLTWPSHPKVIGSLSNSIMYFAIPQCSEMAPPPIETVFLCVFPQKIKDRDIIDGI